MLSGGTFDYQQHRLTDIADTIQTYIDRNNIPDEWSYQTDFDIKTISIMQSTVYECRYRADQN